MKYKIGSARTFPMKKIYFYKVSQQYDADIEQIRRENRVLCTTAPRLANNPFLARMVKIQGTKKLEGEKLGTG